MYFSKSARILFLVSGISILNGSALAVDDVRPLIWISGFANSAPIAYMSCNSNGTRVDFSPKNIAEQDCQEQARFISCVNSKPNETPPSIFLGAIQVTGYYDYEYQYRCTNEMQPFRIRTLHSRDESLSLAPYKNLRNACDGVGNPINQTSGNKYQDQNVYGGIANTLGFTISYNSIISTDKKMLGTAWRSSYDRYLVIDIFAQTGLMSAVRQDGVVHGLKTINGQLVASSDKTYSVSQELDSQGEAIGWTFNNDSNGDVEHYDLQGKLISITDRAGFSQAMAYSCDSANEACPTVTPITVAPKAKLLIKVSDAFGRSLNFTYDTSSRLSTMTDPAGGVYKYSYSTDGKNNLTTVMYPDGSAITFHYENPSFPNALTGLTDENGNRYATWTYDSKGKAVTTEHAGGVEKFSLAYTSNSSGPVNTVVTDPRGIKRTYNFTNILGAAKTTGQSQPGGAGCSASASNMTYDVNGNVASRTDFDGHKTTYQYDLNRNLETSRTEGLTAAGSPTDATRTITTTWHATWSLPLVISEYSGASSTGTPLKTTTHTYDDRGNLTRFTESDPALNLNRTTVITYTYSAAVPGLVIAKVVDGPRTDVNDITTYNYYPHDAICAASSAAPIVDPLTGLSPENLGCRGQLKSVKNALNQITTYNRYNHHGQVEQMTDANGLVTTMTYDLRQRLTSRTVGTETTKLTYDNAGQVIQLQMPDSSVLNYTYDAAHRLTQVQDSLGNKMLYTLDTEGNRIKEDTTDPTGNLAKTLTRSYDALNRLQTVTGIE